LTHRLRDRARKALAADASDDYVIQLAKEGGAEMLGTRDDHFDGIRVPDLEILRPRAIVPRLGG
jgi:hypothetical protein